MKRTAFAWLTIVAVTAAATAALSQPATPPDPAAAPAPPAAAPAPPAADAAPQPEAPAAPPPVAAAPPAPAETPVQAPTGVAAYVISTIEKACLPLTQGKDIKVVAKEVGLRKSRDVYVLPLTGVERIILAPPTTANPGVCILTINHAIDGSRPIVDALTNWAASQNPPIPPLGTGYQASPGVLGWSWVVEAGQMQEGVVFTAQKTPDGRPIGKGYDVSTVLFSRRGG